MKLDWDNFVEASKNGTFLFKRDYMEYHSDRFTDYSLIFYKDRKLCALLPASLHGNCVISHGGLTYGGFVTGGNMTARLMLEIMDATKAYLREDGIAELNYKRVPYIYCSQPSDEDIYALFRCNATLTKCGISSTIYLPERIHYSKGRRSSISRAGKIGLEVHESDDFSSFINILADSLKRHGAVPVHTPEELILLKSRFPDNIKLYSTTREGRMLAGALVYESKHVAHTQYLANTEEGRLCGALDLLIDELISRQYASKRYFDFGISTENGGHYLNEGLARQKQEFGARGVVYQEFSVKTDVL
ncbi:MAG: GNAT family N-acetyltransferase [Bacteroidales bacterium]|nr:GNAT family N-acetyltransferase [Bacteroidales bacterium]